MCKFIISLSLASLILLLTPSTSFSDGVISTGQKTAKGDIVPHIINGYVYETATEKALETAQEDKVSRMEHSASEDLLVGDYPGAVVAYTKLTHMNSIDISYKENLAYALLGMRRKTQALKVMHNANYAKGNTLLTLLHRRIMKLHQVHMVCLHALQTLMQTTKQVLPGPYMRGLV